MQLPITPFSQHEPAQTAELPASLRMISLFYGMFAGQAICTAVTYNLAGFIETHGALTATELAERSGTHAFSLYRLLRALASIGIFQPVNPQEENVLLIRFAQTDLSQTLVPDAAGSVYEAVRWLSADVSLRSWGALTHSIATGEPGLRKYTSQEFWKYLQEHPTDQVIFQEVMTWMTKQARDSILPFYDFSSFEHLVDVAGGRGTLLYSILVTYPHLVGTLFDQVEVIEMARSILLQKPELGERCKLVPGSFFQAGALPAGADCYWLGQILHDWNDEHCLQILRNIRQAIRQEGRLLILERVIEPGPNAAFNSFSDLEMLVLLEGRERTPREYAQLLEAAGFRLLAIRPTLTTFSIVEGAPE